MPYDIRFKPSAERELRKLPREIQDRIGAKLEQLRVDPFLSGVQKLQGDPAYRARVGDYRIVFDVFHRELVILVIRVGHRREVYR
ncbi:MAG: type II toxin-antitoxin system RelE/ParE family toxin [Acidobacteria bacterium]|nr:type II toxin-antitoxin system RelE/ParE family toxin [Acidobacteriota bacterium]